MGLQTNNKYQTNNLKPNVFYIILNKYEYTYILVNSMAVLCERAKVIWWISSWFLQKCVRSLSFKNIPVYFREKKIKNNLFKCYNLWS